MKLKFKKLSDLAQLPEYATSGAAALDVRSIEDHRIYPGDAIAIRTGLAVEVPNGHVLLAFSRSGHGFKHRVSLVNAVGVVDSDYRGELLVGLRNDNDTWFDVKVGDRIAQIMVLELPTMEPFWTEELSDTDRGESGFGSTGQK